MTVLALDDCSGAVLGEEVLLFDDVATWKRSVHEL
jgi:hypothetical protein